MCWDYLYILVSGVDISPLFSGAAVVHLQVHLNKNRMAVLRPFFHRDFSDLWRAAISGAPVAHAECGVQSRSGILWTSLCSPAANPDLVRVQHGIHWDWRGKEHGSSLWHGQGSERGCPIWFHDQIYFWVWSFGDHLYFHDLWALERTWWNICSSCICVAFLMTLMGWYLLHTYVPRWRVGLYTHVEELSSNHQ